MAKNFSLRSIKTFPITDGRTWPCLEGTAYKIFALVQRGEKNWVYGLHNQSEYPAFLYWFRDHVGDGAKISLIDASGETYVNAS